MIRLERIEIKNNTISCVVFVEDCTEPVFLSVDIASGEMNSTRLPLGYEWCRPHLAMAKRVMLDMLNSGTIENEKTIMWY